MEKLLKYVIIFLFCLFDYTSGKNSSTIFVCLQYYECLGYFPINQCFCVVKKQLTDGNRQIHTYVAVDILTKGKIIVMSFRRWSPLFT